MKPLDKINLGLLSVVLVTGVGIFIFSQINLQNVLAYGNITNIASSLDSALFVIAILLMIFAIILYVYNFSNGRTEQQEDRAKNFQLGLANNSSLEKNYPSKTYNSTMTKRSLGKDYPARTYNSTMTKLDNYILSAIKRGHSKETVRDLLITAGWDDYVVDMSFRKVESKVPRL